jgi:hypothetical protein
MFKYFDHTFFKFFFGFLVILAISFLILYATNRWGKSDIPEATYVNVPVKSVQSVQ